jgi:hypothetical protein
LKSITGTISAEAGVMTRTGIRRTLGRPRHLPASCPQPRTGDTHFSIATSCCFLRSPAPTYFALLHHSSRSSAAHQPGAGPRHLADWKKGVGGLVHLRFCSSSPCPCCCCLLLLLHSALCCCQWLTWQSRAAVAHCLVSC